MKSPTTTRSDISKAVHLETGLTRLEASVLVDSIINHLSFALIRGEDVKIASFGKFSIHHKQERLGRNPKTGDFAPISNRKVISFKVSEKLKKRVTVGCKK